ncbi:unnamed protein product [Cladocopium goreaui]|uniref:Uncharacterized protein n=1 Tax=Cladocopium goreaui TaxID=2562237 RepID=A0A9P1BGR5_9DINO|nr:unnamed protein product [Cladocopium goreaui]
MKCTGFHCTQTELKLDHVWPCRRHRSWWILSSPDIGPVELKAWPVLQNIQEVQQVIPDIRLWASNDEHQLALDEIELEAFGVNDEKHFKYLLNGKGKAPCALHAWGSQTRACPCGCRKSGFSHARLASKGLHGCLTRSAQFPDGSSVIRHLHPNEVMCLNTFDPVIDFGTDVRLTLSAVGQIACPLQALWVFGAILERLDVMRNFPSFDSNTQTQAYRSWLLMRCRQVWPTDACLIQDQKLCDMMMFWKELQHLSLLELVFPLRWEGKIDGTVSIASILDYLIRTHMGVKPTVVEIDGKSEEEEIPVFDFPAIVDDPNTVGCMCADSCTVVFKGSADPPIRFQLKCGSTVEQFLQAQFGLTEHVDIDYISLNGKCINRDHVLEVGQLIVIHVSENVPPRATHEIAVSPTAIWSQPAIETPIASVPQKVSKFDVGECVTPTMVLPDDQTWLDASALQGLTGDQFLKLQVPCVLNAQQLWSLRHQFLRTSDRIAILESQMQFWADDEIRFHLNATVQACQDARVKAGGTFPEICMIDPLVFSAWVQNKGFDVALWARDHPEISTKGVPIVTVVLLDGHWVPLFMSPVKGVLNVHTWDGMNASHDGLEGVITALSDALGFQEAMILREHRLFFTTELCGALAIAFIRHVLIGTQLPSDCTDATVIHARLKEAYTKELVRCQIARRPWIWGAGDKTAGTRVAANDLQLAVNITRDQRIDLINEKGFAMGDDEVRFHLLNLVDNQPNASLPIHERKFVSMEPLVFSCWDSIGHIIASQWCLKNPQIFAHGQNVVTAVAVDDHWLPLWMVPDGQTLQVHTFQSDVDFTPVEAIISTLAEKLGFSAHVIHRIPQGLPEHMMCGAQALTFIAHVIVHMPLPEDLQELRKTKLLLTNDDKIGDSAHCHTLGDFANDDQVAGFTHVSIHASVHGCTFTMLGKGLPKLMPLPSAGVLVLKVIEGTFHCAGKPIPQLNMKQIGPVSSGFILISLHDAEPYLRAGTIVSREPLALLILQKAGTDVQTVLPHTPVTVPCRCTVNSEPVLADVLVVQLGTGIVEKASGNAMVTVETPEVATLKIMVYKDELKGDWDDFCAAPIRCLVSLLPKLKRCFTTNCQCQAWHNTENLPLRDPILDVWRRQFLRTGFKPCPASKAEIFSVCLRIPMCILEALLAASGTSGAYCEPRTADGKEILGDYTVVWTQKHTPQEMQHLMQTNPAVTGLARLGERRGLRVHVNQAKALHQQVRPDTVFLPNGPKNLYTVGPFPYGADRQAVAKTLQQAGWESRPLQPTAPCPGRGTMWSVQATDDPEHPIVATTCGEIVITRQKPEQQLPARSPTTVGSAATLALCGADKASKPDQDPWATNDPWKQYHPAGNAIATGPNEGLQQIEERIQSAVLSKLQPPMEDDLPDRVHALEGQVHQLLAKQQGLESQFHDFSGQHSQQINALQNQVTAQAQQLHGHLESQNQNMQSLFEQQMQQISDWNCEMGALPVFDVLEAAGFKDLQDLAHDMWGQPAYMRHVQAQSEHTEHARQIWGSILRATGFSPSFVEWWPHNSHVVHGTVSTIPLVPPEFAVVLNIYESMVMAFRAFEKELHQASRAYARQRRDMDPNVIFHDLKTFQNRGINVLLKPQQAQVEQVHPQTLEIVLDKPVAFDLSKPVFCSGAQLDIIHAEADALWVSQVDSIEVGSTISQLQCKGTDEELFKMFLETWKVMWDRHREVSPGRWDVILQFARDKLRRQSLSWPAIDVNALAYCIQHKRKTTSGGLDGVSLHDLQALPVAALQNFIYMFEQAEDEGLWPAQVIAGRVSCLAKTAEPQHALDFRPITIFSILYRCWGTFHARHAIRAIDQLLTCFLTSVRRMSGLSQLMVGALKGLKSDAAGANATVHLGLIEDPTNDPQGGPLRLPPNMSGTAILPSLHEGSATNFLQEWCFRHNALADKQAVRANFHRPQHFWELFDRHVCACINITEINRIIQRVLLTISREVVRQESPMQDDQMPQDATLPPPQVWRPIPTFHPPDKAIRWYGDPLVRTIASWFWQVVHGSREDLIWVSHFQLYVDFMLTTGEPGPVHQSKWRNGKDIQGIRLLGFSFRQRARWFTKCWKEILRHAGIQVEFAYGKPFSQVVQMYTGCAALPWPLERLSIADEWMLSKCHTTFRRQARIIDSLPFADADDRFQPFLVTTTVA